jgi:hypothetical protein
MHSLLHYAAATDGQYLENRLAFVNIDKTGLSSFVGSATTDWFEFEFLKF